MRLCFGIYSIAYFSIKEIYQNLINNNVCDSLLIYLIIRLMQIAPILHKSVERWIGLAAYVWLIDLLEWGASKTSRSSKTMNSALFESFQGHTLY